MSVEEASRTYTFCTAFATSLCDEVRGTPLSLLRMLAHLGFDWMPQYTIFSRNRGYGLTDYDVRVFVPPINGDEFWEPLLFYGRNGSIDGAVQAAAYNALCYFRYYDPTFYDSPFKYFVGQANPNAHNSWAESLMEPDDTLVETAMMLNATHRLYRSAAYDRDMYHGRLYFALELLSAFVDLALLSEVQRQDFRDVVDVQGQIGRPYARGRPINLRFPAVPASYLPTRHGGFVAREVEVVRGRRELEVESNSSLPNIPGAWEPIPGEGALFVAMHNTTDLTDDEAQL